MQALSPIEIGAAARQAMESEICSDGGRPARSSFCTAKQFCCLRIENVGVDFTFSFRAPSCFLFHKYFVLLGNGNCYFILPLLLLLVSLYTAQKSPDNEKQGE